MSTSALVLDENASVGHRIIATITSVAPRMSFWMGRDDDDLPQLPDDVADAWAAVLIDVHEKRRAQTNEAIEDIAANENKEPDQPQE